ncbi:hypothetical protein MMC26_004203 [Xylographa opegraphella]|nr:hypothetical protein [Xylographa opegraphella]
MEGQYRLEVVTAANSREKSQKENGKRKSQRYHKKYRNVGRTAEVDKIGIEQSALESPDVNDKGNCPPELPSQEGAVEKHDKTAAISKSIIILRNTTGRFSKKRKQKTDSAKHSGKLSGSPSQQARPNDDEPESHTIGLILGRNEPSTLCKTTARLGVMNTPKVVGTRQRGSYPVMQHTATEKAGLKCLESTDTTCHKLQDTNLGNANSPKAKHKRSYRRLHEKQRAQHRMASDASAKVIDVPCSPSKSVKSFRRQKCESVQIADVAYVPGVKKVHWVDEVGVESVERESISCLANQGSASLQDHGLEHQIKAKSLHLKTSHLSFLEHQNLQHFSSTVSYLVFYFIASDPFHRSRSTVTTVLLPEFEVDKNSQNIGSEYANYSPIFPKL